jgi:hypothetical protein
MNWYKKIAYNTNEAILRDHLRDGYNPYDYLWEIYQILKNNNDPIIKKEFELQSINNRNIFNKNDIYPELSEKDIASKWLETANKSQIESIREEIERNRGENWGHAPAYEDMDYRSFLKPQWLIHFTNNANSIAEKGFTSGYPDLNGLQLTEQGQTYTGEQGYNFGFSLDNERDINYVAGDNKYGKEAVIFFSSAVEAYHYGDGESQVIFWGPSVDTNLIFPIEKIDGYYYGDNFDDGWAVLNNSHQNTYPFFVSEDIIDVAHWVTRNYIMIQNSLRKKK